MTTKNALQVFQRLAWRSSHLLHFWRPRTADRPSFQHRL